MKDSRRLKNLLNEKGFKGKISIFPLVEIKHLETNLRLEEVDILVFTSVYAAEKFKIELQNFCKPIFAVGERCNLFLRSLRIKNFYIFSNVENLLVNLKTNFKGLNQSILYLRGNEISYDLKKDLRDSGFNAYEKIVYRQLQVHQTEKLENLLANENLRGVCLFSEKSVDRFVESVPRKYVNKIYFCFSKKIESRLKFFLGENVRCITIKEPVLSLMASVLVKEYSNF